MWRTAATGCLHMGLVGRRRATKRADHLCVNWGFAVLQYTSAASNASAWRWAHQRAKDEVRFAWFRNKKIFPHTALNPGGYAELQAISSRCWQDM